MAQAQARTEPPSKCRNTHHHDRMVTASLASRLVRPSGGAAPDGTTSGCGSPSGTYPREVATGLKARAPITADMTASA